MSEQITSSTSRAGVESGAIDQLRKAAVTAAVAAAAGSVALTLYAGRHSASTPVVVLIAGWVLAPFVALVLAHLASKRWSPLGRAAVCSLMLGVSAAALTVYAYRAARPPRTQEAFVFVAVPLLSWLMIAVVVTLAWLTSRASPRQDGRQPR